MWRVIDRETKRVYPRESYAEHYFRVGMGCELLIMILKDEPRVFVGGGEFGYDGMVREADVVEIAALGERFGMSQLMAIAAKRRGAG